MINAQIDFHQLINEFDWNSDESSILEKFSSSIETKKHYYDAETKQMSDYRITDIVLGDFDFKASIIVDSISRKIVELLFIISEKDKKTDALTLSNEIDNILFPLYGDPDSREDEDYNESMYSRNRKWYKNKYIITASQMIFSDNYYYTLRVKGIDEKENDFRIAKWGDSKASIIKKEGKIDKANIDDIYLFSDVVGGLNCDVAYIFTDDKLSMAKYVFHPSHTNKNEFISDFKSLVGLMTEKYGKPDYNTPRWKKNLYKSNPDEYGFAISLGHLVYNAGWLNEKTNITVALHGENYEIRLMIQYVSKKYEAIKKKRDIQRKTKNL